MKTIEAKHKLSEKELNELLSNWFDRDGKTFVKARKKGRLGWEKTLSEGAAYSEYLLAIPDKETLLKRAYPMAKDILDVMMLPTHPKLSLVKNGHSSYTDGKQVVISTDVFDDRALTNGDKLDVTLGLTVHEGAHIKYTDFEVTRIEKNRIIFLLMNVIEDERIEMNIGEDLPGLSRFLERLKFYYFDKLYKEKTTDWDSMKTVDKLLAIFLRLVRYPTELREEDFHFLGSYIKRIKNELFPYPKTTEEVRVAATNIYEILKEFIAEEEKSKSKSESGDDDSESEPGEVGEGDGSEKSDEKSTDDGKSGGKSKDSSKGDKPDSSKGSDKEDKDEKTGDGEDDVPKTITLTAAELKAAEELMKKDGEKLLDAIEKAVVKLSESDSAVIPKSSIVTPLFIGELEGTVERGERNTFFWKAEQNQYRYVIDLAKVNHLVPAVAAKLKGLTKEYKIIHRSMRSGFLDSNKLAEAFQGVPTVYERHGEVKTDKICVGVLVDESGSMSGARIEAARKAAILIAEAVSKVPNVGVYIYGHSGDITNGSSTDIYVYKEPGYNKKFTLGSADARCQNRDGVAIESVAKRIRKFTEQKCILFILSDGAPHASSYSGQAAINDTKKAVNTAANMGFEVIQVCINHSYDPASMFKHFVIFDNLSELPLKLGVAVKAAVEKFAKVTIS